MNYFGVGVGVGVAIRFFVLILGLTFQTEAASLFPAQGMSLKITAILEN